MKTWNKIIYLKKKRIKHRMLNAANSQWVKTTAQFWRGRLHQGNFKAVEDFRTSRKRCAPLRGSCSTPVLGRLSSYRLSLFLWFHYTGDGPTESWIRTGREREEYESFIQALWGLITTKHRPVADQRPSRTRTSRVVPKITRVVHGVKNTSQVPQRDVISATLRNKNGTWEGSEKNWHF